MSGKLAAKVVLRTAGAALLFIFVWLTYRYFDIRLLLRHLAELVRHPADLAAAAFVYGMSFWLRAWAWKQYVGKPIAFSVYWRAVLLSLFINHLAPVKIGDAARVAVLARQPGVSASESVESVAVMRLLDMAVLGSFAAAGMYVYMHRIPGVPLLAALAAAGLVLALAVFRRPLRMERLWRRWRTVFRSRRGVLIAAAVAASWLCEAAVIDMIAKAVGMPLSFWQAVWVNSATVSGQIAQLTPGGAGTYEAVMAFALTALGAPGSVAYTAAVLTHALKFLFSYAAGAVVLAFWRSDWQAVRNVWRKERERV
ncbi:MULTISPECIES: lysylphosphatidylglycerol synthase transmembrane domain-containing protein [Geobacillus]|nr:MULTISPECIES: lysylphosphatidylglycerol synthase transmembrane domain-containing protein [Geobacillus]OXB90782.1 lysylphosphatidylglycerol synthetase/glycosyltransferase AglD [Geobacillus uzenensis]QIZ68585.1 flippase-like domain-containing protein [Geobacillus subterraneus]